MLSELRAIYFSTELVMPPIPDLYLDKGIAVELYQTLRKTGHHHYDNLDLQSNPTKLSTRHADEGESACYIGPDKIKIVEDESGSSMIIDDFLMIAKDVLTEIGAKKLQLFLQRCTMRFTAQPGAVEDAVELLADRVSNVYSKAAPFRRPPLFFGVRFRFPPVRVFEVNDVASGDAVQEPEAKAAQQDEEAYNGVDEEAENSSISLRLEAHSKDPRQVWMEITASFPPTESGFDLESVSKNIRYTYTFVTEKAKAFLDQFDVKK
jgi:hypothetical protein